MNGDSEEEATKGAALMRAEERDDRVLVSEVEHCWARIEEVGDASERREVVANLVEHVLAADEVVGVLAVNGDLSSSRSSKDDGFPD